MEFIDTELVLIRAIFKIRTKENQESICSTTSYEYLVWLRRFFSLILVTSPQKRKHRIQTSFVPIKYCSSAFRNERIGYIHSRVS